MPSGESYEPITAELRKAKSEKNDIGLLKENQKHGGNVK